MFRDRARTLVELAASFAPMLKTAAELEFDPACVEKQLNAEGRAHLEKLLPYFEQVEDFSPEPINEALKAYVEGQGLKFKQVAPPLRAAIVGYMGGSHLPDLMAFLGKEDSLARIRKAIALG